MNKEILQEQKKLMGLVEDDLFYSQPVPYMVAQKIKELKIQADATQSSLEIAARNFKKIMNRLNEIDNKALVSQESLQEEAKSLMNIVRMNLEEIDKAQDRGNNLLKALDYMIGSAF